MMTSRSSAIFRKSAAFPSTNANGLCIIRNAFDGIFGGVFPAKAITDEKMGDRMDGRCAQWFSIKGGGSCGRPGEYGTAAGIDINIQAFPLLP